MSKRAIKNNEAPAAIGPYSQGIKSGNLLFLSGSLGIDAKEGKMVEGGVKEQAHQAFKNIGYLLKEAGATFDNIVKTTVFLSDMDNFKDLNEVYAQYFEEPYPARSAFAVKTLPLNALVEIEVIAAL